MAPNNETPPALPKTMKAWTVVRNSKTDLKNALQLRTDVPAPSAPPTGANILVKISHAAINPVDLHFINILPTWLPFRRTAIPGMDFVGEIVSLGPGVNDPALREGVQVGGTLTAGRIAFGAGTLAEYVVVPADSVAVKPEGMSPAQAAGMMGVAGQTSVIMVREADLKPGQRVLVIGASGGVGSVLTQVLKGKGAVVYAICSGANAEMVRRLGADEVIDYKVHDPVEKYLMEKFKDEPLDAIFDCAGNDRIYDYSASYLKPGCKFINIVGGSSQGIVPFIRNKARPVILGGVPRPYRLLAMMPSGEQVKEVASWVDEGVVQETAIDSEFAFEDVVQAYERLSTHRAKGKIIVRVAT